MAQLKKKKNEAKVEFDRMVGMVGQKVPLCVDGIKVVEKSSPATSILQRRDFDELLESVSGNLSTLSNLRSELKEFPNFSLAIKEQNISLQSFRNPFDIPRKSLIAHVAKMRTNFLKKSPGSVRMQDDDQRHAIPVQEMGNYQDYLKRMPPPLREVENIPVRQHMFGNPFKVNKAMMADEIDEVGNSPSGKRDRKPSSASLDGTPGSPRPKRKPGPLPREITLQALRSPPPSPPTSPAPSAASDDFTDEELMFLEPEDADVQLLDKPEGVALVSSLQNGTALGHPVTLDGVDAQHLHKESPSTDLARWLTTSRLGAGGDLGGARPATPAPLCNGVLSPLASLQRHASSSSTEEEATNVSKINHRHSSSAPFEFPGASDPASPALKRSVLNEVRRPGKNFNALFAVLSDVKHPPLRRLFLVRVAQREALRFKRKHLADMLQNLEDLLLEETTKS